MLQLQPWVDVQSATTAAMLQGLDSVVVEEHIEGAVRVSVAVVEGSQGPTALLPSQEELVCPEADFIDANIESERKQAQREVPRCVPHNARLSGFHSFLICVNFHAVVMASHESNASRRCRASGAGARQVYLAALLNSSAIH